MTILGIHSGHDANCCLVRDGVVVADAQEERFARVKHSANVPVKALEYCLRAGGISDINEVDRIAIASHGLSPGLSALFGLELEPEARPRAPLKPPAYFRQFQLSDPAKVRFVEHHLAHASAAHFTRRTGDRCLVFTLDGIGDGVSAAIWDATGNKIIPLQKMGGRASFAWAYSAVTEALGWRHGDGEGKTMGLAPYGDAARCSGVLDRYFPIVGVAGVEKSLGLGAVYRWPENGGTHWHFDEATEIRALVEQYSAADIAAEAQQKLEQGILKLFREWIEATGIRRIACSGGLFQNVKLNQRVWAELRGTLDEQHIFPNPGDAGLGAGAALWAYYEDRPFAGTDFTNVSWGPRYSACDIGRLVQARHIKCERVPDPSARAAALLADGNVVGWFQGRMESGPRALGKRSILMNPGPPGNKDIINAKVKGREAFQPFCPSLLWEKRGEYLLDAKDEYFMITSFDVNPESRNRLAAVVHVDGTVRPQMVKREHDERYWRLIKEFGDRTGTFAVLNTSMNLSGEPIVNTPNEALRLFFDSGLDAIIMEDVLIQKGT